MDGDLNWIEIPSTEALFQASQLNYTLTAGHEYAHFSNDLELMDGS